MAKKNIKLRGLVVTLVIALGWNIVEEVAARDVKLVKLRDVKPETLTTLKGEEERELMNDKLVKEIENAKKLLGELKKETKGEMKEELSSLVKSESLLNDISDTLKNGTCDANKATLFVEKESFFYRAWKENAYHAVVPEKEKEFMSTIKRIVQLLKKT